MNDDHEKKKLRVGICAVGIIALTLFAAFVALAQDPAQLKEMFARSQQQNEQALKQYTWKSRNEVRKNGESKSTQLFLMRYDALGNVQKSQIGGSAPQPMPKGPLMAGIVQKKKEEMIELINRLSEQVKTYSHLPPAKMQAFLANATIAPRLDQGMVQIQGGNIQQRGDSMTIWLDLKTRKQRRVEIITFLENNPVKAIIDFDNLPTGPTYMTRTVVDYPKESLQLITENFDYELARTSSSSSRANTDQLLANNDQLPAQAQVASNSAEVQTATISRSAATLTVSYNGQPQFKTIEGTTLKYAVNTSMQVIAVSSNSYYAVTNGVWFVATTATGPWIVATSVPAVIYTIPASSPVHNVTYVRVYSSTSDTVYVGYTRGYYGTVVSTGGVYYASALGGAAAVNVYGQWGNAAYVGTRAAWANPYTGNVGQGGVYSGVNTATGTRYNGSGFTNANVYTGTTVSGVGGTAYNPNTGRTAAGQAGAVSNAYTGNAAAGARGVNYNPQTGVISGGAAGATYNAATGQTTAAGRGFSYNTKTDTGVAVGKNNVYATKDGEVYRYDKSEHTVNGGRSANRSAESRNIQSQHGTAPQRGESIRSGSAPAANSGVTGSRIGSGSGGPRFGSGGSGSGGLRGGGRLRR